MCEKLARLDSVSDSCDEEKEEEEVTTDETKGWKYMDISSRNLQLCILTSKRELCIKGRRD